MREVKFNGEVIDLECVSKMSTNYDAKNFAEDTEYIILNASVLGNSSGEKTIEGDDKSSALAAVHGRKYNNARCAIPFTRKYVDQNYNKFAKLIDKAASKMTGQCSSLQKLMTAKMKEDGRETQLRTAAIREARKELENGSSTFDREMFSQANASIRARAKSKVEFNHGVAVSARRVSDTEGLDQKGNFKRKTVMDVSGKSYTAYTTIADEAGLKKVPLMNIEMKNKAEEMVYKFALVVKEEISKLDTDFTDAMAFDALKNIIDKMDGDPNSTYDVPDYTEEELEKIRNWKEEIISNYRG